MIPPDINHICCNLVLEFNSSEAPVTSLSKLSSIKPATLTYPPKGIIDKEYSVLVEYFFEFILDSKIDFHFF